MIFKNKIIFNEAKKQKTPNKEEDIDIKELKKNIKSANSKMEKIITGKLPKDDTESKEDEEIINSTEKKLNRPAPEEFGTIENVEGEEEFDNRQSIDDEIENDEEHSSNDALEFEDDGDDLDNIEHEIDQAEEEEIDYMGDENDNSPIEFDDDDDYEDDDLDDIEDRLDDELNDKYANDGEFDPDEDLSNIEADIEDSNFGADDYDEPEYDEELPPEEMPQQQEQQPELKERKAEVNPLIDSGDGAINLPTDGLDDDGMDPNSIDSQIDSASGGGDGLSGDGLEDPLGMDTSDPLYSDLDSDDGAIEDPEEKESERLKKIVLLKQYKELITVITDFKMTVEHLRDVPSFDNDENINYIIDQLQSMKDKIMFTVEQKFLDADYKDLLKIYYYFKFGLNSTSKFMEKLINSKQNNKQ